MTSSIRTHFNRLPYAILQIGKRIWCACGAPCPGAVRMIRHNLLGKLWPAEHFSLPFSVNGSPLLRRKGARSGVAAVIPCHNYGSYLRETIESLLAQTMLPENIVVVDDASDDSTRNVAESYRKKGVRYLRGEWKSVSYARNAGAKTTLTDFILFMDADDILPQDYIEKCLEQMRDPRVGIAYGDMHHFGDNSIIERMQPFEKDNLSRLNFISSHALMRRQAFDLAGGYRSLKNAHEDWDLYRRILSYPWTAAKADTYVRYRVHDDGRLKTAIRETGCPYWKRAALLQNPITIFTPFAGRTSTFERYVQGLRNLDFDHSLIYLHWLDTSGKPEFGHMLRATLATMDVGRTTYSKAPLPALWEHTPQTLIEGRVQNINNAQYYYEMAVIYAYNTLLTCCPTEYVLVIEDDIVPEPAALKKMLKTVDAYTAAVVAHYECHIQGHSLVWYTTKKGDVHFPRRKEGIEEVGGSGFGCSLFRVSDLRKNPFYTRVHHTPPEWYDHITYKTLQRYGKVLCNWDIDVEHLQTERYLHGSRKKVGAPL